jgi:hypothetical protein
VLLLVSREVLGVQKAFLADITLVWSLKAAQVGLTMATSNALA